jgi:hypothetical protein
VAGGSVKVEPRSDVRSSCIELFAMFVGMVDAGFTEEQSLRMVSTIVQTMVLKDDSK